MTENNTVNSASHEWYCLKVELRDARDDLRDARIDGFGSAVINKCTRKVEKYEKAVVAAWKAVQEELLESGEPDQNISIRIQEDAGLLDFLLGDAREREERALSFELERER